MIDSKPRKPFIDFLLVLRGTRPINLALLAWALISFRYFLMLPVLETRLLNFGLENRDYLLMVLGALLIAGAGNLINDYFDRISDHINHKGRPVLDEPTLWAAYWIMNGTGLGLCAWSAWQAGLLNLTLIPIAAVFLLFRYSEQWKGQGWIGPGIIVLLCCIWVTLPWLYEFKAMGILYQYFRADSDMLHQTWLIYLILCAMVTLTREIIKACEDYPGDQQANVSTVAVLYGSRLSFRIATLIWACVWTLNTVVMGLQWINLAYLEAFYSTLAWLWATWIGWTFIIFRTDTMDVVSSNEPQNLEGLNNSDKKKLSALSQRIKVYFAMGILSLWVYYMIFLYGASAS
jgi:4-hydroxybenzoate polyprenyltransferase